jgi:hypothetical protein
MRVLVLLLVLIIGSIGVSASAQPQRQAAIWLPTLRAARPADWLHGTWSNDLARYRFNLVQLTQTREAFGIVDTRPMVIERESADQVTFRTSGDPIVAQRISETRIRLTQVGRVPVELVRE